MSDQGRFGGRTAVVTGGASGIGEAIALRFAREGARVSLWDRDTAALGRVKAAIPGAHDAVVDVARADAVSAAAAATESALGRIDILVCSAGITGPNAPVWEYPLEEWRHVFEINVHGLFYCNRAVVPAMRRHDYGRIVNIASIAGKEGNPNAAAYSAAKAAVIGLTKSLGKELASSGIRVNCVTPAAVETPIFAQMSEAQITFMKGKIPIGRFGTVDEVTSLVCWLASEECSFSTGAVFDVSGGRATY
ncbi:MAG: SDR family NAD(P)-dependent oxidoreductase [Acetobacteraceae bacterium]